MDTFDDALRVLAGRTIAVITGAGISTDSGIPDYRGEGSPTASPMSFATFLKDEEHRKRYWAGSHQGWKRFADSVPNAGHSALATMERAGIVSGVVTQNVDGLHREAGSAKVIELHGTMNSVFCLSCGQFFAREAIAHRLSAANPWLVQSSKALRPDGDSVPEHIDDFAVPACTNCRGMLKPNVVFFGELVPRDRFHAAFTMVEHAEALLIAGSSLAVNSGIRLLDRAVKRSMPVVIINRGPTKGDSRATVRLEGGTSELLAQLADRL